MHSLKDVWSSAGADWSADGRAGSFGNAAAELRAAVDACVLADRSDFGRIRATGRDVLELLHRLSTADVRGLPAGEGRPAVLTTGKGRIVDRIFVHHLPDASVLLVTGAATAARVGEHVRRFTFREEIALADVTGETCQLALVGPSARKAAAGAGIPIPAGHDAAAWRLGDETVDVLGGDGYGPEGVSFVTRSAAAPPLWSRLAEVARGAGGCPAGDVAIEAWRVLRGHGASGREITEEHNPLEAGLLDAVSFTKGCYVGQEVVARLRTYDKVSRALVGLVLPEGSPVPEPGTTLFENDSEAGSVTSAILPPGHATPVALAYVRRAGATPGSELRVGAGDNAPTARVVSLPISLSR